MILFRNPFRRSLGGRYDAVVRKATQLHDDAHAEHEKLTDAAVVLATRANDAADLRDRVKQMIV